MLRIEDIEVNKITDQNSSSLQILEKLNKEIKLLTDEKQKIIDSHNNLRYIMDKRIESKRRNNGRLKLEIEKHKENCIKMARSINSSIKFEMEQKFRQ
jgi:hypothetical protein